MFQSDILLGRLQQLLRAEPENVAAFCEVGRELAQLGRSQESRKCYRAAVDGLRRAARAGNVGRALECELLVYEAFVKTVEDEQHYYRCFADWKDELAALGRRFRDPAAPAGGGADRIAFVLQNGHVLGHTEVLLKLLESRPRDAGHRVEARIYVLDEYDPGFLERCRSIDIEVVLVSEAVSPELPVEALFIWLRERFRQDRVGACIWVSIATVVSFAYSMRIAPVQIFWALRFHPLTAPYIDGYISWGAPGEQTRRYGNQEWQVAPMPLAIDDSTPEPADIENLRRRFPETVLLGTLAREEKINSLPYLKAVAEILAAHPQAGFVWTGRSEHPAIAGFLRAAGVAARCHFVGWVDTRLYAAALDVFLESFPFGSGITSFQAFAAGVPLLSYLDPQTIFGTYFWERSLTIGSEGKKQQPRLNAPDEYPILCASSPAEYVALAGRLISDTAWRAEIGARGRAFFREELRNNKVYAERFFAIVARIANSKLGNAALAGRDAGI